MADVAHFKFQAKLHMAIVTVSTRLPRQRLHTRQPFLDISRDSADDQKFYTTESGSS